MNKIQLPEAVAAKYEFAEVPQSNHVILTSPVRMEIIFSQISLEQAEALAKAGKFLKAKAEAPAKK